MDVSYGTAVHRVSTGYPMFYDTAAAYQPMCTFRQTVTALSSRQSVVEGSGRPRRIISHALI